MNINPNLVIIAVIVLVAVSTEAKLGQQQRLSMPERYGFGLTCPEGTVGHEAYDHYVCADGPEGMGLINISVSPTDYQRAINYVEDHNRALAMTDSAYMMRVRETNVSGVPAVIVKQTFGSEAGPTSPDLSKSLLVIHDGRLYTVTTREYLPNAFAHLASFHFTK